MITIIAALTHEGVIGKNNALPWDIPEEMKHFRTTTTDCTVIMGYATFLSIGKALPKRVNIVLAPPGTIIPGVSVTHSTEEALELAKATQREIFVIGGAYTYAQFIPHANRMILSYIKHPYPGTVFFPTWNTEEWTKDKQKEFEDFTVITYLKRPTTALKN